MTSGYVLKAEKKSIVLSWFLQALWHRVLQMAPMRAFQIVGVATRKAREALVVLVPGITSRDFEEERRSHEGLWVVRRSKR